jgi:DnaJ-class molecular chaperone
MEQKNYYEILGIAETADANEIKSAYRKLAKQYHPDKNPGDTSTETLFKEISEAYEILSDSEKRRKYDELRRYSTGSAPGKMSFEDFMHRFGGERRSDAQEFTWGFGGGLEDIFSTLFGGRQSTREQHTQRSGQRGSHSRHEAWSVRTRPAPQEKEDSFFRREGGHAWVEIPVNVAQLMLGSTLRVRTPNGRRVLVRIHAGTQPDAVLRVSGHGFRDAELRSDLLIRLRLSLPANLTEEQRSAVRDLADRMGWKF